MILHENFDISEILPPPRKICELFIGRFQPVHNAHAQNIKSLKNGFVAIVKGSESSKNRTKNPLPFELQEKLIKKIAPDVKVIKVPNGYVPEIINMIRAKGYEVKTVVAGSDRIEGYRKQLMSVNARLDENLRMEVSFRETTTRAVTSGTYVRELVRAGDIEGFKKNTPRAIWGEFDTIRKAILLEEYMTRIMSFTEYLAEESANVTAGVENQDKPMGSKPARRKDGEDDEENEHPESLKDKD